LNREQQLEVLREVAGEVLAVDPDVIVEEARFREELGADSLDLIELVTALEDRCSIRIPEDALKEISTVAQALNTIGDQVRQADAI
jgi:acyl carrier protein